MNTLTFGPSHKIFKVKAQFLKRLLSLHNHEINLHIVFIYSICLSFSIGDVRASIHDINPGSVPRLINRPDNVRTFGPYSGNSID